MAWILAESLIRGQGTEFSARRMKYSGGIAKSKTRNKEIEENMNNKFDELTKCMAQSVTRRAALKQFGVGLAGMALACFGLANEARAGGSGSTNWLCQTCMKSCRSAGGSPEYCRQQCQTDCK